MFTLWYSILSFKEYSDLMIASVPGPGSPATFSIIPKILTIFPGPRPDSSTIQNSACNGSGSACAKSNDVRPSSPKPIKPSIPVQIPTKAPVPVPVPIVAKPLVKPTTPHVSPVAKAPAPAPAPAPTTPLTPTSTTPNRFQQLEQQQENRTRGGYQASPLAPRKPDAAASAQFIKRENSYSSEEEEEADEDDEDEEDSEIERIDLHHK